MTLFLQIVGGIALVGLGVWLGMGQSQQTPDDIDQVLGRGKPRKAKRHFMWLNYLKADKRASERRAKRTYFKTAASKKDD